MKLFRILPVAMEEVADAVVFYNKNEPGVGVEFYEEFENSLKLIRIRPEICPKIRGNVRKLIMNRFPYSILFIANSDEIVIYTVMHQSRRPGYWKDRL